MGRQRRQGRRSSLLFLLLFVLFPGAAKAELPYETWFIDQQTNRVMTIQPLYVPSRVIGRQQVEIPFSSPTDLFIAADDHVFIADSGNNRVVELDAAGTFVQSFGAEDGEAALSRPEGVFVTAEEVYVADSGNGRIAVFDRRGTFLRAHGKPETVLLPDEYYFDPVKLIVDSRGVMYIVNRGSYEGLMRMGPDGDFRGFFGANKTPLTWLDRLKRAILSKEQLAKETPKQPGSIENVTLAPKGQIVTTNRGVFEGQLKLLNAGGVDRFGNKRFYSTNMIDAAVDADGFLYAIDMERGEVTICDPFGNELFFFGALDNAAHQYGIVSFPASIAVNSNRELWIADNRTNVIQVLKRTSFGDAFMTAAKLYFDGKYEESKRYWEEVIDRNGMINLSFQAMGKVALQEGKYAAAAAYFRDSYDAEGYSEAFWNQRYEWIQRNLLYTVLAAAAAGWAIRTAVRRGRALLARTAWPSWAVSFGRDAKDAGYLLFHPFEGFYRLKDRNVSLLFLITVLAAVALVRILSLYGMGFIFHPYDLSRVHLGLHLAYLFVPWATWVAANYLVSAVKGGEGRFREVLQASTYALLPYVVVMIPVIAISQLVVLEEKVVVDTLMQLMWIWMCALFVIMTQVIHNFDFLESIRNTAITLFTISVIWIFGAILAGLTYNLYDFLLQVYREVTFYG